ncbi:hypothetical protein GCK72_023157 [Caenorhabditis remanei]|uniref:Uncharacterized protein n=1 Tax=Caenorhabditis remanei TaxID=31234 RepID=A0A6A5FVM6_CAERE|nr:hypothetical protein GCK72_023157 [Caenorhabditis remanei]KAF1746700.1 hypothetical protein GCK72_023157 [Caenorhabditis remanei]
MPCVPKPQQRSPNASFNPAHAQYACCFQQLHSNTGAILIAIFHIILCSGIFTWLVKCIGTEKSRIELAAEIFLATLCLIAAIILLLGLKLESRKLLTGYVLAQSLPYIRVCVVVMVIYMITIKYTDRVVSWKLSSRIKSLDTLLVGLLFVLFLALIMGIKPGILDDPDQNGYNSLEEELLIVLEIFISLAVVIIEVWFLTIVLKSYSFFTDKYNYTGGDREENV